ncbi:MAG: hypothetical protein ACK4PR_09795, partial [Gammaproteobacteria bacterium]
DIGSADASFLLACRTLEPECRVPFPPEDAVVFLRLAADRGHAEAAYQLACCYAAIGQYKNTEQACANYFNSIESRERSRLAEHYFHIAANANHREAIEELIIAYAYGRGFVAKDASQFSALCEKLVTQDDQAVALGYGAWLAGMTVEGEPPLPDAIHLPPNYQKSLDCLMMGAIGANVELAQHALHLICIGIYRGIWDNLPAGKLAKTLHETVEAGNQLLALYFAWYSIPLHRRCPMPELLDQQQLTQLSGFVEQDETKAMNYLDKVLLGANAHLSAIAKELLLQVFGFGTGAIEIELLAN